LYLIQVLKIQSSADVNCRCFFLLSHIETGRFFCTFVLHYQWIKEGKNKGYSVVFSLKMIKFASIA